MILCLGLMAGCGNKKDETPDDESEESGIQWETVDSTPTETPVEETVEEEPEVIPEGMYRSELTNEIISEDIKTQRPIAVMIDNESTALPHYEVAEADIVYEQWDADP